MPPELSEYMSVVDFQVVAVATQERLPIHAGWHQCRPVERRLGLFVGHLQEEQVSELLEVIAVRESVVSEDVAIAP
jgi:hypothetical protein